MKCRFEYSGLCCNSGSRHYAYECKKCECMIPISNAERIRSMTDEELAKWLEEVDCWNCECCLYMRECRLEYDEKKHDCATWRMHWLKQPYKEDT